MKDSISLASVPNIRQRIGLITGITVAILALQTVSTALGEITLLSVLALLISIGINALLLCSLYRALKLEHTAQALGTISVTSKVLFVGGCVLCGLVGLIVLLFAVLMLLAGTEEAGALWIPLALIVITAAAMFVRVKLYGCMSKVAKQLKAKEYDASETPEKWALICTVVSLALLIIALILLIAVPTMPEIDPEQKAEHLAAEMVDKLINTKRDLTTNILQYAINALQCASCYAVYLLFKTLRQNLPASKKNTARRK